MKVKLFCALLAAVLISAGAGASAKVSEEHSQWAQESLTLADEAGILPEFFSDGDLTANITRLDFCRLAYKMLDAKSLIKSTDAKSAFTDTDDKSVALLAQAGVIHGRSETLFAPNDSITREEAAVILTNTAEFMGVKKDIALFSTRFSDFKTVSEWAKDAVCKMDALGIMRGMGENNFSPKSSYTKEQSAVTMLKLFNLDISNYAEDVQEIKIDGDLSLFYSKDKQWIKNADTLVLEYDAPEEDIADNERSFVFFEKSGKWYFYIHNNKSESYYRQNNKCSDIYSADTGEIVYNLMVEFLERVNDGSRKETIEFADDYYMVTTYGTAGAEPVSLLTNMELYSYEGEKLASSHHSSYLGGDFLDKEQYPCNNRQVRVDFEKAKSPSGAYFVPGENLLKKRPYKYSYSDNTFSYYDSLALKGYTPVKLSTPDENGNEYAIFNPDGGIFRRSDKELLMFPYKGDMRFAEAHGHTIDIYDMKTEERVDSFEWEEDYYCHSADDYLCSILAENIECECASPNGNYTVNAYNLLCSYPYNGKFLDFLEAEGVSGYTPVCKYVKTDSGFPLKYFIYNPDGEILTESDREMYLIKYNDKACYVKVSEDDNFSDLCVYTLADGELIGTIDRWKLVKYKMEEYIIDAV